ncbi:MAG: flagellar motor switch protein FliG [Azoarcus sp.]|jgi:flagellar motor switch protein FliG|nr:flagellar motor switch protein FliG [Azoarcus sp.]
MSTAAISPEEGLEKSALLLAVLGTDEAAGILKHLGPREVQKLGMKMATMPAQERSKLEPILSELEDHFSKGAAVHADQEQIREMLTKALGDERAANLIARVLQGSDTAGIENLKWLDPATASDLIKNEHPQIIATILVHLGYDQAGDILKHFSDRLRNDVVLRIATLDGVQPQALKELNESLTNMLAGAHTAKKAAMGGVHHVAEILNFVGSTVETAIIDNVREYDADLAQKILDEMFVFENLLDIDDRGIQTILREIQSDVLIVALKGASPDLREKIFKNMSTRAAEILREDLEAKGPVRLSEVEAAQKEILKTVHKLSEEGRVVIGGKGGEDAFV